LRRLLLPALLVILTVVLLFRTPYPQMAVGFGVLAYAGIEIIRQGIAAIRTGELILPRRYGLNFNATGNTAVAQGWLRAGIGVVLLLAAATFGWNALAL